MSDKQKFQFPGKQVNVDWDGRLCIHIGECGQSEGELFVGGREPWCQPDLTSPEQTKDVVERCPSGALTWQDNTSDTCEQAEKENKVTVACNGPYFVSGQLNIDQAGEDMPGVKFRAALCRCGQSRNKPFCDNSHEGASFKDYGAIGETGSPTSETGGELSIKSLKDGPLILEGNLTLTSGSGRTAWQGNKVALCRCGASNNKPFCDGSHKAAGFKS
ncbi:hypothetical protein MNBD_GAMMA15-33 [hydrothermal vent metagenome]|uniref:Iron-binding zinc finger CDGSH type domain-containing protein n=1 Tax=hydrothermal vent metagenome TaxID=652676 RepID=A0A3B0YEJ4_9ZZZZ